MEEPNIAELAVATWRLERWLDNLNAERKMAAKKSLREIKKFLDASDVEVVDPLGWKFDPGLAVEVVNNEADDVNEEELIIIQTSSPIVKQNRAVIQYGKIILGMEIKEQKANHEIKTESQKEEAVSMQNKLFFGEEAAYWIKRFDCKVVRADYQAVINVNSNIEIKVLLMDEQVYSDYCRGILPRNLFRHVVKAGASQIPLPYPDVWYMLALPPAVNTDHEYMLDTNCVGIQKKSQITVHHGQESDEKNAKRQSNPEDSELRFTSDENRVAKEKQVAVPATETDNKKKIPNLTDKELERLKKKNLSSFYKMSAVDRGLLQIHGKKKK